MAIIVEPEKKPVNLVNIIALVVFVILLFVLVYYIFFKNPELVETVIPKKLQTISSFKEINVDPDPVINNLRKYFTTTYTITPAKNSVGRANPFEPF